MSTSTDTQPDTSQGVLRAAFVAITEHMADHQLPVPLTIDTPSEGQPPYVRIRVAPMSAQQAWIDTAFIDGEDIVDVTPLGERVVFHLRLPDTGTRVELVGLREADVKRLQPVAS